MADKAAYLFEQAGSSSGALAAQDDVTLLLTLLNAPAQTVYFPGRPDRLVGAMPTDRLREELDFDGADPSNALLVIEIDGENTDVIVFELAVPSYDADVASLAYTITLLQGFYQFVETGVGFVWNPGESWPAISRATAGSAPHVRP